jgi:protein-S-isoprenylcysteine O-methyltransferase Ste14
MRWVYEWFSPVVWAAYVIYWQIAAAGAKANARIESVGSRVFRTVLLLVGVLLMCWPWIPVAWLYRRFLPMTAEMFWVGAAVTVAGLLFCVWARVTLGRNWSRSVTIKQGHELITAGPYALVRHPIYTGLLTGFAGTAIALGGAARGGGVRADFRIAVVQAAAGRAVDAHGVWGGVCGLFAAYKGADSVGAVSGMCSAAVLSRPNASLLALL